MSTEQNEVIASQSSDPARDGVTWGPWVFRLTLAGTLLFMWWLVIYDHGVTAHH